MKAFDTHCHIHSKNFDFTGDELENAKREDMGLIVVGTDADDSKVAVDFVVDKDNSWASIGLHPHDSKLGEVQFKALSDLVNADKVVAIGECGLDYFYNHSTKTDQEKALRFQIELALENDLPLIFHVREAFDNFWPIFDSYKGIRGVLHSFTDSMENMQKAVSKGLYIGINGIATFTKDENQIKMFRSVPLENILLETDSPFLTPVPLRGKSNEPANLLLVAEFLSELRGESKKEILQTTTGNAKKLFMC